MANKVPLAIADVELQLATAISVGSTSFTLSSANDDDGNALPAGLYCFTIDGGTSQKEYLIGQLNSTSVTSVKSVSRQGVETTGAARAHRVGATCVLTNFATLQRVADILRGQVDLDGANPVSYDAEPTLADRKELATVGYVLDTAVGGTVAFESQTTAATAGESIVAGDLVYFNTSDGEWYKCDADTASTVENVTIGIALGTGSNGVAITGGVLLNGIRTTTGLTANALYYASNTAGAIATSAGTTKKIIGVALSTTRLFFYPANNQSLTTREKDALAGGGALGTPSSTNKFITQTGLSDPSTIPIIRTYLTSGSPHTWTKPAGLKCVIVEVQGAGGNGGTDGGGGGGGGYARKVIVASSLGATETVTVGAGGVGSGNTSFGSHATAGNASNGSGTSGGTASGGDVNINGGAGQGNTGGKGGDSVLGFGGVSPYNRDGGVVLNGQAGSGYGGGGGGGQPAADGSPAGGAGGSGAPGIVIVTEYYS